MIVTLNDLEPIAVAPAALNVTQPYGGGWLAIFSMSMPGSSVVFSQRMYEGESIDTPYGVKISFDRAVNSTDGIFTIYQGTNQFNFDVTTDRYSYSQGDSVRIDAVLSGSLSINFRDAVVTTTVTDPNGNQQDVKMSLVGVSIPVCTQSVTTGTYTCAGVNEYHFVGTYFIPSGVSGNYRIASTAIASSIEENAETSFNVGGAYSNYVDVSINPEEQHTIIGKDVSYEITVTDRHPVQTCPIGLTGEQTCVSPTYAYYISVSGLPYNTKYPAMIQVPAGGSVSSTLTVFPSSTGTSEGVTTATTTTGIINSSSESERVVSVATGEAVATTTTTVPQPIKEAMFKFTVQATQQDDSSVTNSDGAILFVDFVETPQPPQFPEEETVNIELRKGWNLLNLPGKGTSFTQGSCSLSQKPIAYVYMKDLKRYATLDEAATIMTPENLLDYLSTHSFWVYSYESCNIGFNVTSYSTYSGLSVDNGWNMLGTTKDMVGETLSDIKGTCNIDKVYVWNADSQQWSEKTESDLIEKMGYGILVKTNSACVLKENTLQTPNAGG